MQKNLIRIRERCINEPYNLVEGVAPIGANASIG